MVHRFLASVAVLAALSAIPLAGQDRAAGAKQSSANTSVNTTAWTLPRTSDGHPDFQGIWANATLTPMERPAEFAEKLTLTEAEAAAFEKQRAEAANMDRRDGGGVRGKGGIVRR